MLTFADDKMVGFTQEYADKLKHKCGTHFSSGLVDVGVVSTHNGKMAYTCEICICLRNITKIFEEANKEDEFAERRKRNVS